MARPSLTNLAELATTRSTVSRPSTCFVTATFRLLYVSVILSHARRKILHVNVTPHLTADWLSCQITEAFPWDTAPRYLLEKFGGALKLPRSLIEVDDVDLVTFFKDVRLHLRVPALGLMTKVDPCFEQLRY